MTMQWAGGVGGKRLQTCSFDEAHSFWTRRLRKTALFSVVPRMIMRMLFSSHWILCISKPDQRDRPHVVHHIPGTCRAALSRIGRFFQHTFST